MKLFLFITLFSFSISCSLFKKNSLSSSLSKDIGKVCLNSEGKGRLIVDGQKYLFSYASALNSSENQWQMGFSFPIYGEEFLELEWDENQKLKYQFSFEDKILKEQKGISPESLEIFIKTWADLLLEIIQLQSAKIQNSKYQWQTSAKELAAETYIDKVKANVKITFKNLVDDKYFGRYDIVMQQNNEVHPFTVEFIVRKCLEDSE